MACNEHSMDSMCIYVHGDGYLFTGDTPLFLRSTGGTYSDEFVSLLRRLIRLPVRAIYPGHDVPVFDGAQELISQTLAIVERDMEKYHPCAQ